MIPRLTWPPYQTLRPLIHRHVGRPAVIMGGGPSMHSSVAACPEDAIYISTNDHGCRRFAKFPDPLRAVSYIVACDKIEERVRPWGVPILSRHMWADNRLLFMPAPSSGMAAAWCARLLGCAPIILIGMDLYCGPTYFDDPEAMSSGRTVTDRQHLRRWITMSGSFRGQYRALGCSPLLRQALGQYDPQEAPEAPLPAEQLAAELRGQWCRLTRDATISLRQFKAGVVLELNRGEAEKVVRERLGVRLASGEQSA